MWFFRIYLHLFRKSDNDPHMHDHPCGVLTFLFRGRYKEHTPVGAREYTAPSLRWFPASRIHRISIPKGYENKTMTLCMFMRNKRKWGFFVGGSRIDSEVYLVSRNEKPEHRVRFEFNEAAFSTEEEIRARGVLKDTPHFPKIDRFENKRNVREK